MEFSIGKQMSVRHNVGARKPDKHISGAIKFMGFRYLCIVLERSDVCGADRLVILRSYTWHTPTDTKMRFIYCIAHWKRKEARVEVAEHIIWHINCSYVLRAVHFVSIQVTLFRSIQFAFVNLLSLVLLSMAVHCYCWAISSLKRAGCSVFILLVIFIK